MSDRQNNENAQPGEEDSECLVCMRKSNEACPECRLPVCGPDLNTHRFGGFCQLWRIKKIPGVGRVMVAARDIVPWERVLHDSALVVAPDNNPVCVRCLGKVDGTASCEGCGWAVCSPGQPAGAVCSPGQPASAVCSPGQPGGDCCHLADQHTQECRILSNKSIKPSVQDWSQPHWIYSTLAIVRVLLAEQSSERAKRAIPELMDHWDLRRKDPKVLEGMSRVHKFISTSLGLDWVTLESVQHAFGILKTNAVGLSEKDGRMLFPLVSILSHSCHSNLEPVADMNISVSFRAKRKITKGEEMSMRYTSLFASKHRIQEKLYSEWHFLCSCSRCQSPDEFQSNISSPQCECTSFYRPNKEKSLWICEGCCKELDYSVLYSRESEILQSIETMNQNEIRNLRKELIEKREYHRFYHVKILANIRFLGIVSIDDELILHEVHDAARDVYEVLRLIDNGCSRINGKYLMMMLDCKLRLLQMMKKKGEIVDEDFRRGMKEIIQGKLQAAKLTSTFTK